MSDAWHSAKIKRFEHLTVDPGVALLRLTGRAPRRRPPAEQRPTLVIDDGRALQRFDPVPSPPDERGVVRAAYSVPAEALADSPTFSLQLPDGRSLALPAPTPVDGRLVQAQADVEARVAQAHTDAAARVAAARADADERIARAQADAEARIGQAERRTADAEADAERAQAQAAEAGRRAQATADEIERRVAEGRAQARAEADARAAEAAAPLRRRLAEAEEAGRRHEAAAKALALEVDSLRDARAARERDLRDALDSVRKMTFERDELSRQVEAFDQVATKARERAGQAEAENERSAATLSELQTWRGELERRLAGTTSELGAARVRLREDERELQEMRTELADAEARAQLADTELRSLRAQGAGGASHSTSFDRAERERLTAELATLRAARAVAEPGPEAAERIRRLEAAHADLAQRAEQLAAALEPAGKLAELARGLAEARTQAELLHTAASGQTAPASPARSVMPDAPALGNGSQVAPTQLDELGRRALAEASERAERELAEAADRARPRG